MKTGRTSPSRRIVFYSVALWLAVTGQAKATDEIQVYNAGIAEVGQFTIQQHLNYIPLGVKDPPFPGGLISHNSLNGTPEFAYGLTDWWEVGLYLPFAIKDQVFYSNAFKLRTLFVSPHAEQRNLFYGVNFEFSNETPPFAQTRFAMEIRPIIGLRNSEYEFIVNPIIDIGFGKYGEQHFAPAARLARKLDQDLFVGLEYYSDFGQIGRFGKFADQEHTLFAVTDFKLGVIGVNFGVGYGRRPPPTAGSSRPSWVMRFRCRAASRRAKIALPQVLSTQCRARRSEHGRRSCTPVTHRWSITGRLSAATCQPNMVCYSAPLFPLLARSCRSGMSAIRSLSGQSGRRVANRFR
jgi:hypothetical protein